MAFSAGSSVSKSNWPNSSWLSLSSTGGCRASRRAEKKCERQARIDDPATGSSARGESRSCEVQAVERGE